LEDLQSKRRERQAEEERAELSRAKRAKLMAEIEAEKRRRHCVSSFIAMALAMEHIQVICRDWVRHMRDNLIGYGDDAETATMEAMNQYAAEHFPTIRSEMRSFDAHVLDVAKRDARREGYTLSVCTHWISDTTMKARDSLMQSFRRFVAITASSSVGTVAAMEIGGGSGS
jgi:hypothetical protein